MTESDSTPYEDYFPEVRRALVTDIGYAIALAKAANTILTRRETMAAKREENLAQIAERTMASARNAATLDADDVVMPDNASGC